MLGDCASRQYDHLIDRMIEIKTGPSRRRFLDLLANPFDDLSGPVGSAYDTAKLFLDLAQVRRLPIQEIQSGTRVVAPGGDRLGDFVRQRGSQFSHHAHAIHVSEIRLQLVQSLQRQHAILDVYQETVPARDTPGLVANWGAAVFKPPIFAVEASQAQFLMEGSTGGQ